MHVAFNDHLGGLGVKFDLRFEISNLNYTGIKVHVASSSYFGGLRPLQPANDLGGRMTSDLNCDLSCHASPASTSLYS